MKNVRKLIIFLQSGKTVVITNPEIFSVEELEDRFTEKLEGGRKCVYIKNTDRSFVNPKGKDIIDELHMFFIDQIAGVTISSYK